MLTTIYTHLVTRFRVLGLLRVRVRSRHPRTTLHSEKGPVVNYLPFKGEPYRATY